MKNNKIYIEYFWANTKGLTIWFTTDFIGDLIYFYIENGVLEIWSNESKIEDQVLKYLDSPNLVIEKVI